MSNTDGLDIQFWTDKNGRRRVAFGDANVTPYDLDLGLLARRFNSIKANTHHGKLDGNRYKLHNQIIREYFKNKTPYKKGETKKALFTGGGSASGKGNFSKNIDTYYSSNDNPVKIDSDELKHVLRQADIDSGRYPDGKRSDGSEVDLSFYHAESTVLAKRLYEIAVQNNYPVMFDATSTQLGAINYRLQMAKANGYKTEMCYMVADANTILDSSLYRYKTERREVPLTFMMNSHILAQSTAPALFERVDKMTIYNRSGINKITPIAKGGIGKNTTILDQQLWNNFQERNAYQLETGAVNAYLDKLADIKRSFK